MIAPDGTEEDWNVIQSDESPPEETKPEDNAGA